MGICWVDGWNLIDIYWNFNKFYIWRWTLDVYGVVDFDLFLGWGLNYISFNGCLTHLLFGLGMFFFLIYIYIYNIYIYGWKWLTYTGICCQSAWHFWWDISWDTMKCGIYFGPGFNMWWTSGVEEFSKIGGESEQSNTCGFYVVFFFWRALTMRS